jgi:acetyl esterase/lipase
MRSDAFHPDLRRVARWLPRRSVSARTLKAVRSATRMAAGRLAVAGVEEESIGEAGVRLHLPRTQDSRRAGLLWIHGGGFVMGSPVQDDALCHLFADELGIVVAAVDYRLAPEHPFPAPLEDCYAALVWLAARPDVDRDRIAIAGASAGGGLAAALAILADQRGEVGVQFQSLAYPMIDDRTVLCTDRDRRPFRLWDNRANRFGWESYLGRPPGSPGVSALAAPGRLSDLAGLPAAWIGVGSCDLFYDEDADFAHRLMAAGVDCTLHVVDGAYHGFDLVQPKAAVSRAFRTEQMRSLAAALAGSD